MECADYLKAMECALQTAECAWHLEATAHREMLVNAILVFLA
jgi:hypothetical protein